MPALLFLAQRLPFPPDKGEKIRAFHELRYLSRWYDIHLGCLTDHPADLAHVDALRPLCRSIHVAPITRRRAAWNCLRGALSGEALSVAFFRDAGLARWVREVIEHVRPAVTFIYSSNMAPYVLDLPRSAQRIADLVDVDSEKWRALAATTRFPMRWVFQREHRKIAELERRTVGACDLSLFVSQHEAALFAHHMQGETARIHDVSNGVDQDYFNPTLSYGSPFGSPAATFVFTGTMDYRPNIDAVTWFAHDIFPLIRRMTPDARFCIVGSSPAPEVRRLARRPGVIVTGQVTDVRPYLAHATACVAPMRIARGIQNKVLEAMAMARPIVLTRGALEGINAVPDTEVILANTPEEFATACCRLINANQAAALGAAARSRILKEYHWNATLRPFDDFLKPVASALVTQPA